MSYSLRITKDENGVRLDDVHPSTLQRDEPSPFGVDAYDDIPDRLDDWDLT